MHWPLKDQKPLFPDEPGRFGSIRRHDIHTGIDLYCELGQKVIAMEDGRVVSVEKFTGPNAEDPSPWWNDTSAILIEGEHGVIVYGELTPFVSEGQLVKAGEVIGTIDIPVLKSFKGRPMVMLHLELMTHGSKKTLWWEVDQKRPHNLCDVEKFLLSYFNNVSYFDLSEYDGVAYVDPNAPVKESKWWNFWKKK